MRSEKSYSDVRRSASSGGDTRAEIWQSCWMTPDSFGAPEEEAQGSLVQELQAASRLKVQWARHGAKIEKGHVYLSRPGESLLCLPDGTLGISPFGPESSAFNPVDTFLQSAVSAHGHKVLSLVL